MAESVAVTMRVDKELKMEAQELFNQLGLDMSTAYNLFLRQAVRTRSIPFEITAEEPDDRRITVDRRTYEIFAREYAKACSMTQSGKQTIPEDEMLKKYGVEL